MKIPTFIKSAPENLAMLNDMKTICVSIPRSGHHFLVRILLDSQGASQRFCEMYTKNHCCHSFPCTDDNVSFQKTHDFRLDLERNLRAKYVILYRDFLNSTVSEFLLTKGQGKYEDSYEDWIIFSQYRKRYWIRFMQKWVLLAQPNDRYIVINYEDLSTQPLAVAARLAYRLEMTDFDMSKAAETVALEGHRPRVLQSFKYYEGEYFYELEASLSDIYLEAGMQRHVQRPEYDQLSYSDYWERRSPVRTTLQPAKTGR